MPSTVDAGRVVELSVGWGWVTMRELHLFAGSGGGILGGMLLGHEPVCAVEIAPYCRQVLQARQDDGWLPKFPIYEDVKEFDGKPWRGKVDVVAGGFPCQPWSSAGKKTGAKDPRHLWPEMARIIKEIRPRYVFAENVSMAAFEEPWRDLRGLGYRVPPAICVAAEDVGAPHLRKRWWMLAEAANADSAGASRLSSGAEAEVARVGNGGQKATDADSEGLEGHGESSRRTGETHATPSSSCWWKTEPPVGRVVDGLARRVDRLKALGNGQVPMAAATAWGLLMDLLRSDEPSQT